MVKGYGQDNIYEQDSKRFETFNDEHHRRTQSTVALHAILSIPLANLIAENRTFFAL